MNIQEQLKTLEKSREICILFACESGSRAWGFPSTDSDYDIRFIYAHPLEWYLSIEEKPDVIELPIDKELDFCGWELRKMLRLVYKHNAAPWEWIQSPIVYCQNDRFIEGFRSLAPLYFSPTAALHHYLSLAKKCFEDIAKQQEVTLKKYMYCIRSMLAALWVAQQSSLPPMELKGLLPLIGNQKEILNAIASLVALKATQNEAYTHPKEKALDAFLSRSIEVCTKSAASLPSCQKTPEHLNAFLKSLL